MSFLHSIDENDRVSGDRRTIKRGSSLISIDDSDLGGPQLSLTDILSQSEDRLKREQELNEQLNNNLRELYTTLGLELKSAPPNDTDRRKEYSASVRALNNITNEISEGVPTSLSKEEPPVRIYDSRPPAVSPLARVMASSRVDREIFSAKPPKESPRVPNIQPCNPTSPGRTVFRSVSPGTSTRGISRTSSAQKSRGISPNCSTMSSRTLSPNWVSRLHPDPSQSKLTPRGGSPMNSPRSSENGSVWSKLYAVGMTQKTKKEKVMELEEQRRQALEEKKLREVCTFKPDVRPFFGRTVSSNSPDYVFHRLNQLDTKKREKELTKLKERIIRERDRQCTFHPNNTPDAEPSRLDNTDQDMLFERLHRDATLHKRRMEKLRVAAESKEDEHLKLSHMHANPHFIESELRKAQARQLSTTSPAGDYRSSSEHKQPIPIQNKSAPFSSFLRQLNNIADDGIDNSSTSERSARCEDAMDEDD